MYSLSEKALALPLVKSRGDHRDAENTSIAELLRELNGQEFKLQDELTSIAIERESEQFRIKGPSFNLKLALSLLELQREGIKAFATRWFWYDKESSSTDPTDSYRFFVAHESNIVRTEVLFLDYSGSGFDPTVWESYDADDDENWLVAWAAYWYRRFYKETQIGQLMILRPDSPTLHYYPEGHASGGPSTSETTSEMLRLQRQLRALLWIIIALLAFIAYRFVSK